MSDPARPMMSSERATSNWMDKLLQLNSDTNVNYYSEVNCAIADMKTYCKVSREKLNQLKNEVEKNETTCKYLIDLRDTWRQFYDEVKLREKCTAELIKMKKYNSELINGINDLRKEKALEIERQNRIIEKQRIEEYNKSIKIFESYPLIIKRKQLRNQVNIQKFRNTCLDKKISDLEKTYAMLQKTKKQIEQNKIIKFAQAMLNYYKYKKEREIMLRNRQDLKITKEMQDQNISANLQRNIVFTEAKKKLEVNSFANTAQYDYTFKKQLSNDMGTKYSSSTIRDIETTTTNNMKPVQLLSFNIQNYQFDPTKYLNTSSFQVANSDQKCCEPPKNALSNLNISKAGFKLTMPKSEYNFQKLSYLNKTNQERLSTNQNIQSREKNAINQPEQKPVLKRQSKIEESTIKPKMAKSSKMKPNIKVDRNTETEKEERVFLSQPDNRNLSQYENSFVSLSQDSQNSSISSSNINIKLPKSTTKMAATAEILHSQNNSQTLKQNKMFNIQPKELTVTPEKNSVNLNKQQVFNFQSTLPKMSNINEPLNQNQVERNLQMPQIPELFNVPGTVLKSSATKSATNSAELGKKTSSMNMFNLQATMPSAKNVQFSSPKAFGTKSPYFVNPTTDGPASLNTSTDQSDTGVIISSDQAPSQISSKTSAEYYDPSGNQPSEIDQMMNEGTPMDYNNSGYMMEYYRDNPALSAEMENVGNSQYLLPSPPNIESYTSPPNIPSFTSPPREENLEQNTKNIIPPTTSTTNSIFGAAQNTGNSFFTFGQSIAKSGNIFNMF